MIKVFAFSVERKLSWIGKFIGKSKKLRLIFSTELTCVLRGIASIEEFYGEFLEREVCERKGKGGG